MPPDDKNDVVPNLSPSSSGTFDVITPSTKKAPGDDVSNATLTVGADVAAENAHVMIDRNSVVNSVLLIGAIVLAVWFHWSCILLYPASLFAADVLYYVCGVCVFDPELCITRGYQFSAMMNDTLHSVGLDYGFNFYDGNYKKTRRQAQVDKFEYAYRRLKLKPGMSLLDCGCGCGDWIYWLQTEKGIRVTGVNITFTQVNECRKRGLNVICSNWKSLDLDKEGLTGKFDAVTFWDTVEHYVNMKDCHNYAAQDEIYTKMFNTAFKLMKKDTESGRIFISCLHLRHGLSKMKMSMDKLYKMYYCYLLDKFHSGYYPSYGGVRKDQLVDNAKKNIHVVHRKDTTMDYYMTSVLEPTHFGVHKFSWTPFRILYALINIFLDPHWFHRILWYYSSNWMLQFDTGNIDNSDMILWWLVFERN